MKLSKLQRLALADFDGVGELSPKSNGWASPFELGLGTRAVYALHEAGLLERRGYQNSLHVDYRITDAGRAALKGTEA